MGISDKFWMQQAYEQALIAQTEGEVPVGAVLISNENKIISFGRNSTISAIDPCGHAEINAIKNAAINLKNHRLLNTTLYVTLEPCLMCAGALIQARIERIVFACRDFKTGAAGSVFNVLNGFPLNHKILIDEGIMQQECSLLLEDFFKARRLLKDG